MMATKELPQPSVEHEEYGKLTIQRHPQDVKPLLKKKFTILTQDNEREIIWIQLDKTNEIIALSYSAMIHILRN